MLRRLLAFATVLTLVAGSASATTEIRVSSSPAGTSNCISAPETNQLINFHVVVFSDVPLSSVSFSVVIPPALIWIDDTPDFAATTGNSPTGTTITFGGCQSGPIHVMTVRCVVSVFDPPDCQFALVQDALALDCDGQAVTVSGGTSRVVPGPCEISGPSNPSPPDHAQDVPLNSLLAWTGEGAHTCVLGEVIYYSLYFGSDPNPPLSTQQVAFPGMTPPHPLAPGTQYYWRVLATQYGYNSSLSPVWTFRTAGPVPTQASTWGRIKSLYRR